jgi:signal transduction histidine kinase
LKHQNKNNSKLDLLFVVAVTIITYIIAGYFELAENWLHWTDSKEKYQLDEIIFVLLAFSLSLIRFGYRRNKELQLILKKNVEISTTLKESNIEISNLLSQNRALIKHNNQVREEERSHLASELHDVFGQHLAAIDVNATVAYQHSLNDKKLNSTLKTIKKSANYLIDVTRSELNNIKPPNLDAVGLSATIEDLITQWLLSFPMYELTISIDVNDEWVNYDTALSVYRCLQEGLSNIVKHAEADTISINLVTNSTQDNQKEIKLTLQDNGIGFDSNTSLGKGLGLISMRERITALSGEFGIFPAEKQGSTLMMTIPL